MKMSPEEQLAECQFIAKIWKLNDERNKQIEAEKQKKIYKE